MSVQLVVNGQTYNYPELRSSPPWGEGATAWAEAVTELLGSVVGQGDIILTTANIANNQPENSPANVVGLAFDTAAIRGAIIDYTVYRVTTGGGATELSEQGSIYIAYKSTAATWNLSVLGLITSGVTFSITNQGQIQYWSTNITGSAYSGTMKFRARAIPQ